MPRPGDKFVSGAVSKSFVTGSQVYGTPHPDSDIDLVVLVSCEDLGRLTQAAQAGSGFGAPGGTQYEDGLSLRFGGLNLLCVTQQKHFDIWKQGTESLIAMKPVTREFAVQFLANLRRQYKIEGW